MKTTFQLLILNGHPYGIVTTKAGYVYACCWAKDTVLTVEMVKTAWREDRRAFIPFNTSTGLFLR